MKPAWLLPAILFSALTAALAQEAAAPQEANAPPADPIETKTAQPRQNKQERPASSSVGPPPVTLNLPPAPLDPNDFRVSSNVELVLLDVSVKDEDGGFVSGLTLPDFKVLENRIDQKLTIFHAQDVPVTVGLIVDNSGSVRSKKPEIVTAALTFVKNSNPNDELFVVNFNDRVLMGLPDDVPFTSDTHLLRQGLLMNPARGRTALYDALMTGLDHLQKGRLDKKTLVLISDGGDNMSTATKEDLLRRAEESLVTIYTVGIYDSNDRDRNPGFLKELARITGGEAYLPGDLKNLVPVCEKIAHDIRNRYTVGYVPSNREFDGKPRKLKVLAGAPTGKKYSVRTRTHYLAPTPRDSASRTAEPSEKK